MFMDNLPDAKLRACKLSSVRTEIIFCAPLVCEPPTAGLGSSSMQNLVVSSCHRFDSVYAWNVL